MTTFEFIDFEPAKKWLTIEISKPNPVQLTFRPKHFQSEIQLHMIRPQDYSVVAKLIFMGKEIISEFKSLAGNRLKICISNSVYK